MTTRVITLSRVGVVSLTTSVSTMRFVLEIMFILKTNFKGTYDIQNLIRVVILYAEGLFHKFHMK